MMSNSRDQMQAATRNATQRLARALVLGGTASAFLLGGLLGSAEAGPRYNKQEVKVQAAKKRHTEKGGTLGEGRPTEPSLQAEEFREAIQARVGKLTDAAIATLKRLIRATPDDDPEKPDFYFRLAEHYRDKKVEYGFRARELDEKVFLTKSSAKKRKLQSLQKRYEKAEKQWMVGAIKLYLQIANTKAYAKYKRMDEVLYNLADMLNQAKRRDRARIFFGELIRNYPASKYIPDAYLSFAEYYFEDGRVEEALRRYQQVAKYRNSPLYGYALYKQAWCWINLKDARRALELFVKVIRESSGWAGSKKSKIILVREAKKDVVRAFAVIGNPDKAWPFFRRIGGSYAMKMLERLANLYYDQGMFGHSIQIFKQLMALNRNSPKICKWQYSVVRATLSGKSKSQQVAEVRGLAAIYQTLKRRGNVRKNALAECRENTAGVLRELATTWHNEAQKTQNKDTYALAQYLYREYLDTFPNEPDAYVMAYYYAELLFKLQRWKEAAEAYTRVVEMKAGGKHLQDAAYAAVLSWRNALNVAEEVRDTDTVQPGQEHKPRPISASQTKMVAAFDTYLKHVPRAAKERPTIVYRKGRIFYEHNHFRESIKMFAEVIEQHPKHELAPYAANLLLDALNIMKDFDGLERWVEKLWASPLGRHAEVEPTITRLRGEMKRTRLEVAQKEGRYRECGAGYAKLASEYPDDPKWPELAYNSALCFEAAKMIGPAIKIREQLIKVVPKNPLAQKAMYMIGANYHGLAWYSRAAAWYERFAKSFPGEKEAPEAMQNAIVFRLGRAEYEKAAEDIRFFARTYGKRPKYAAKTAQVVFSLGAVFEHRNDLDATIKHYTKYLRTWGRYGGKDRMVVAHVKIGAAHWRRSCPIKGLNGACIKVDRVRSKRKIKRKGRKRRRTIELRKQCGPETKNRITVVDRKRRDLSRAMGHFNKALALGRRAGVQRTKGADKLEIERRGRDMRYAMAQALFHRAEAKFEAMLKVEFPKDLNFSDRDKRRQRKSVRQFTKYLSSKGKRLESARSTYQDVIKQRVPHWAIAAAARVGQLFQNFADALYTAPVPKPSIPAALRTRSAKEEFLMVFTDAYCERLEDKATPLEAKAIEGLEACLGRSTELSWYNEWSGLCEAELNQIQPAKYPIASEIRAEPGYMSFDAVRAKPITDLN